jgi:hypothetical protein
MARTMIAPSKMNKVSLPVFKISMKFPPYFLHHYGEKIIPNKYGMHRFSALIGLIYGLWWIFIQLRGRIKKFLMILAAFAAFSGLAQTQETITVLSAQLKLALG